MLRRFLVQGPVEPEQPCVITGSEARHILKVLRMKAGDRLAVAGARGAWFQAVIQSATRQEVRVFVEKPIASPPLPAVPIVLCQALLKAGPMDYMIQKTSELGVKAIFPFFSERTIVRLEEGRLSNKMRHWNEVSRSAAKQSGRPVPARINSPLSLKEATAKWKAEDGLKVILWEGEERHDLKALLRSSCPAETFVGIIGPEGGFPREEIDMAADAGFIPISLGDRILRAETAGVALAAIVQYEWGDLALSGHVTQPKEA